MQIIKKINFLEKLINSLRNNGFKYTINRVVNRYILRIFDQIILKICVQITEKKPLKNIIILQSHGDFDCNGGALYDYFLKYHYNKKYKLVWILNHEIPQSLPQNVEAYSLLKPSFKKNLRICYAKFFFADDNVIIKVKTEQVSVYCTHGGICFKDVRGKINLKDLNIDYVLSPSKNYSPFVKLKYNLDLNKTEIVNLGYPSLDYFFMNEENEYNKLILQKFDKYILWMPTFRRGNGNRNDSVEELPFGIPLFKNYTMFKNLNEVLKKNNILLTIKIHPSQNPLTYESLKEFSNIKIITPQKERKLKINKYNLMKNTDALISDYSGAAYEYLLLNKPLGFVVSDIDAYKIGFIVKNIFDYMPGEKINTYQEFVNFIRNIIEDRDLYLLQRKTLLDFLYKHQNGDNCRRIADFLKIEI